MDTNGIYVLPIIHVGQYPYLRVFKVMELSQIGLGKCPLCIYRRLCTHMTTYEEHNLRVGGVYTTFIGQQNSNKLWNSVATKKKPA